jgi:exodeoxyribonuclease VII large subunit
MPDNAIRPSSQPRTVYAVSELADILRGLLEDALPAVWVQGEISNFRNPSGHWYFTLKDAGAQIRCAMFKGKNFSVRPTPRDGDAVLLRGQLSFYTARGDLQLVVEHLEPAGEGALLRAFEQLKARLAAEGLFDERARRPLPSPPRAIGIITSAGAAALQDILSTLSRRFPLAPVFLYPVPVQGETAPPAIVEALAELPHRAPVDVVILARGGGSLEDLWCFNDERVARAIRACLVPVVTGIGHEIDFTIADFAADLRAPTPTAAAERVAPDLADWQTALGDRQRLLADRLSARLRERADALQRLAARVAWLHPGRKLEQRAQRLDELQQRLRQAGMAALRSQRARRDGLAARLRVLAPAAGLAQRRYRLQLAHASIVASVNEQLRARHEALAREQVLLSGLSPRSVLKRGYAIARRRNGETLREAGQVSIGEEIEVLLEQGSLEATVEAIRKSE